MVAPEVLLALDPDKPEEWPAEVEDLIMDGDDVVGYVPAATEDEEE